MSNYAYAYKALVLVSSATNPALSNSLESVVPLSCSVILYSSSTRFLTETQSSSVMAPKKRCKFQMDTPDGTVAQCTGGALRFAGTCEHCFAQFCTEVSINVHSGVLLRPDLNDLQHRLPEHHNCSNLADCRQQAFDRNRLKLESERTVASKMVIA